MKPTSALELFYLKNAREIVQRGTLSAALGSLCVCFLLILVNWHFNQLDPLVTVCGLLILIGNLYRLFSYFNRSSSDEDWFDGLKWTHRFVMFGFCGIFIHSFFDRIHFTNIVISYLVCNALVSSVVFWQFLVKEDMVMSTTVYLFTAALGFFIWSDDWTIRAYGFVLISTYFAFLLKQGFIKRDEWYRQKKDEFELRNMVQKLPTNLIQATGLNFEAVERKVSDSIQMSISDLQTEILNQLIKTIAENERKTADLARADKMASIGEMLSGIMHEINNPISIITSRIQLIKNVLESEVVDIDKLKKSFEVVSRNAYRTSKIITGVKTLFRETSADNFVHVELKEIILNSQDAVLEKVEKHEINLEISYVNCGEETMIFCFPLQISQVLINLIGNSSDAIRDRDEKWIKVRFERFNSHFGIFVTDSGIGLTEEVQKKIELPFYTSKKAGEGSGIGLHISKKIIESHRGRFYYNSESQNTEFVIELPLQAAAA